MSQELLKILAVIIITAIASVLLRGYKSEYAIVCALAGGTVALFLALSDINEVINVFYELCGENAQIAHCFKVALKALAISYLTSFTSDLCRDFGQSSLASKAELCGRIAVFMLALPMLKAILELAIGMVDI